jgi:hypothetical protein
MSSRHNDCRSSNTDNHAIAGRGKGLLQSRHQGPEPRTSGGCDSGRLGPQRNKRLLCFRSHINRLQFVKALAPVDGLMRSNSSCHTRNPENRGPHLRLDAHTTHCFTRSSDASSVSCTWASSHVCVMTKILSCKFDHCTLLIAALCGLRLKDHYKEISDRRERGLPRHAAVSALHVAHREIFDAILCISKERV